MPLFLAAALGLAAGFTLAGQMLPEGSYPLARIVCTVLGVSVGTFAWRRVPREPPMSTALDWFMASPEFWFSMALVFGAGSYAVVQAVWAWGQPRVARALANRRAWPQRISVLLVAVLLSGCATLHRHPGPIGTPSPEACFASQQALDAWVRYVEPYIRATLEAQAAHSCTPPVLPTPPAAIHHGGQP